ncbi:glycoside hydrolase family 27 protein [Mesonia aestuariivivens]|uniref:Glycoside hydrolase family 27 protein n=1 Tax=Mesonia aestuariivivens TaxID=2796128 RepID=A0ABS6W4E6_9FLAO|nr:glycoside hydrolase family 27 protein [Mesonia aestuariivivens]MBW2962725.1 glycoside hydrolase family 27 protein [Mesonia aestuariivivens]
MKTKLIGLIFLLIFTKNFGQKFENLAQTPPMGWNSWNKFACNVNEQVIKDAADYMVSSGMKDAGYNYVVIDDCWHGERDSLGFITADKERFPSGMKALIDYVHSKGLKFGIYSDAGWQTCGGRPGSRGREFQDAQTYAKWGVDYLKYDWCETEGLKAEGAYMTMRNALREAGRPIVLSICEWGDNQPWEWGEDVGHLWRTTGDIYNCFDCEENHGTWSSFGVLQILDMQDGLREYAGPGHWNDPDMMEVGNGMSVNEDRAHFTMWCMIAAPLIAGNDLANMSQETIDILTNKEMIAINQDPLGIQGFKYKTIGEVEVWFKPLQNKEWAVTFLNRGNEEQKITFDWKNEKVMDELNNLAANFNETTYKLRDVWKHKSVGNTKNRIKLTIPAHNVVTYRLLK